MTIKEFLDLKPGDFIYYYDHRSYIHVFCIVSSNTEKITYHLIYSNDPDRKKDPLYVMYVINVSYDSFQVVKDKKRNR